MPETIVKPSSMPYFSLIYVNVQDSGATPVTRVQWGLQDPSSLEKSPGECPGGLGDITSSNIGFCLSTFRSYRLQYVHLSLPLSNQENEKEFV